LPKKQLFLSIVLTVCVAVTGACRGRHQRTAVENEEPADASPRLASTLRMSDPAAPAQLVRGFYGVEGGTWRWTAGHFTVMLKTPLSAAQHGATLTASITVPDVVIQKLHSVTLTASIGGKSLKSETYEKPGPYTFGADVPADLLAKDSVTIDFSLDKSLPPGAVDQRELGIIATSLALESK